MALKISNVELDNGIQVNEVYAKIDSIGGTKDEQTITLNYYVSQQFSDEKRAYLQQRIYTFEVDSSPNSINFIQQGYEYLKTLEEYENALDC